MAKFILHAEDILVFKTREGEDQKLITHAQPVYQIMKSLKNGDGTFKPSPFTYIKPNGRISINPIYLDNNKDLDIYMRLSNSVNGEKFSFSRKLLPSKQPIDASYNEYIELAGFILNITMAFRNNQSEKGFKIYISKAALEKFRLEFPEIYEKFNITILQENRYSLYALLEESKFGDFNFNEFFNFCTDYLYGYMPWITTYPIFIPSKILVSTKKNKLAFLTGIAKSNSILLYGKKGYNITKSFYNRSGFISYRMLLESLNIPYKISKTVNTYGMVKQDLNASIADIGKELFRSNDILICNSKNHMEVIDSYLIETQRNSFRGIKINGFKII